MRMLLLGFFILMILTACRKEEKITTDPSAKLQFSSDTILFDTIFTSTGSTSRRLRVYNPGQNAVIISNVELSGGNNSPYQININGQAASNATDILLAGKDSMNVFIKVFINPGKGNMPFVVSDSIQFLTNGNRQTVHLNAYGQDANFFNQTTLTGENVWTNSKPYVIYNSILIEKGSRLSIQKGTKVYFHKGSKMLVAGTLKSEGEAAEKVLFAGDRLETIYNDEPGQWEGIHFLQTSRDNMISYSLIKNALAGIRVDSLSNNGNPKLILNATEIKNMQVAGLIMYNAEVAAFNNLIQNCGQFLVYGVLGGKYNFKQNTFAGLNFNFNRQNPAVYFADYYQAENIQQSAALVLTLTNNIIWGSNSNELVFDQKSTSTFQVSAKNNLIKASSSTFADGNILNADPMFSDPQTGNYGLTINSPGLNKGLNLNSDPFLVPYLEKDIKNSLRIFPSDLGCYELN